MAGFLLGKMTKYTSLESAQSAANAHEGNVIAVKVFDGETHFWAIRYEPETSGVYL